MFPFKTLLVFMMLLTSNLLVQTTSASPIFASYLDQKTRQEILTLADRIAKLAQYGGRFLEEYQKRNGGTLDALYNMPDLEEAGRRSELQVLEKPRISRSDIAIENFL